jgi:hypothetical protein
LPIHVQMASTSHCADDAIFPSPFTSTIPARPGVYLDKEAKKKEPRQKKPQPEFGVKTYKSKPTG